MSNGSAAITEVRSSDIAIIAMNCRSPGVRNINQFWENQKNGVESLHAVEYANAAVIRRAKDVIQNA